MSEQEPKAFIFRLLQEECLFTKVDVLKVDDALMAGDLLLPATNPRTASSMFQRGSRTLQQKHFTLKLSTHLHKMCLEKTKLCLVTICPCKQMCVWVKNRMWRLSFKQQLWKCLCWLWWYKQCDSSQTLWRCGWTHRYPSIVSSHMLQYVRMGSINVVAGSLNSEEHLVSHTRFLCHCRQSCVFMCVCVCHSYISAGTPILHQFIYLQHIRISSFLHSLAKPAKGFNVMPESLI